jgi:hypothetical protein
MNDFERGFRDELQKIAVAANTMSAGTTVPQPKGLNELSKGTSASGTKGFASAMRAPLSLVTALRPPKQEFYKGI